MRQVVLDTETTGLDPLQGHRVIEIGCVELRHRRPTRCIYHQYLNPGREVEEGALSVHGIRNEFLADKPRFADVAPDFLAFIEGAELVIHNAAFDVGFLNHELRLLGPEWGTLEQRCTVLDTLALARQRHPGQKNSLDALCRRYGVDNSHRDLHGALLDAQILADVYLAMTGGQATLELAPAAAPAGLTCSAGSRAERPALRVIRASDAEMQAHRDRLADIDRASGGGCVWLRLGS
jgi:DNA polymerase-3 subunit epsilon